MSRNRRKQRRRLSKAQERARREQVGRELLAKAEVGGIEHKDGQTFTVTVLPEKKPPKRRSANTRYHFKDVGKEGNL